MADTKSIKAILSARDQGFTSTMNKALSTVGRLGKSVAKGVGFGSMMAIGQKAVSAVGNGVRSLVSDMDKTNAAWTTFSSNMKAAGHSTGEIKKATAEMKDFASKSIYYSSDMASTYAQLDAVGTKNTANLVKGFGAVASAAENPTQAMKSMSQQATQMAAKPTVAWQDFKIMMEQTPAGISQVAKQMGMSTKELVSQVQGGTVKTKDFFSAISKIGGDANHQLMKNATHYKTIGEAISGTSGFLMTKLAPAWKLVSKTAISALGGIQGKIAKLDPQEIKEKVAGGIEKAKEIFNELKPALAAFGSMFKSTGSIVLSVLPHFARIAPYLTPVLAALKGFQKVRGIAGLFQGLGGGLSTVSRVAAKMGVESNNAAAALRVLQDGAIKSSGAATTATGGFGALKGMLGGLVSPAGLAVAAVAGVGVAIGALQNHLASIPGTWQNAKQASDEAASSLRETTKSYNELKAASKAQMNQQTAEIDHIGDLKKELDGITDANGRVKKGYGQRAEAIVSAISKATGIEMSYTDGVVKGYGKAADAVDKYVEKKRAQIAMESNEGVYKKAMEGQKMAEKSMKAAQKEMANYNKNLPSGNIGAKLKYDQAVKDYQKYAKDMMVHENAMREFEKGDYEKAQQILDEHILTKKQQRQLDRQNQQAEDNAALQQQVAQNERIANSMKQGMSVEQAVKAMMTKAQKKGIEIPKGLAKGIKSGMYELPTSVKEMERLVNFVNLSKKAQSESVKIPKSIAAGIKKGKMAVPSSISQLNSLIKYNKMANEARKAGGIIPKNIKEGIASGKMKPSAAVKQMEQVIKYNKMASAAKKAGGIVPKNIESGIKSGKMKPSAAVKQMEKVTKYNKLAAKAKKAGVDIPQKIKSGISSGKMKPSKAVKQMAGVMKFAEMTKKAKKAGVTVPDHLKQGIVSGKVKPSQAIGEINKLMAHKAIEGTKKVGNESRKTGEAAGKGVKSGGASAKTASSNIVSDVVSKLMGGASKASSAGRNISAGFAQGMNAAASAAEAAAARIVAAAERAAAAKAKMHSPSRLFAGLGRYVTLGFAKGIVDTESEASKAGARIANAADRGVVDYMEIGSPSKKAAKRGKQTAQGLVNGIKTGATTLPKTVAKALTGAFGDPQVLNLPKKLKNKITAILKGKTDWGKVTKKQLKKIKAAIENFKFDPGKTAASMVSGITSAASTAKSQVSVMFGSIKKAMESITAANLTVDMKSFKESGEKAFAAFEEGFKAVAEQNLYATYDAIAAEQQKAIDKYTNKANVASKRAKAAEKKLEQWEKKRDAAKQAKKDVKTLTKQLKEQRKELKKNSDLSDKAKDAAKKRIQKTKEALKEAKKLAKTYDDAKKKVKEYKKLLKTLNKKNTVAKEQAAQLESIKDTLLSEYESMYNDMVDKAKDAAQAQKDALTEAFEQAISEVQQKIDTFYNNLTGGIEMFTVTDYSNLGAAGSMIEKVAKTEANATVSFFEKVEKGEAKAISSIFEKIEKGEAKSISSLFETVEHEAEEAIYDSYGFLVKAGKKASKETKIVDYAAEKKKIDKFKSNLKKLEKYGVSSSYLEEIEGMSYEEGLEITNQLLKEGSKKAIQYGKDFDALQKAANSFAKSTYKFTFKDQIKQLRTLKANMKKLEGWGVSTGLIDELSNMSTEEALEATNQLLKEGKKAAIGYGKEFETLQNEANSFASTTYKFTFADQLKQVKTLKANLEKLKGWGVDEGFLDNLANMSVEEGLAATNQLLKEGKKAAIGYGKSFEDLQKASDSLAQSAQEQYKLTNYQEQAKNLKKLKENLKKLESWKVSSSYLEEIKNLSPEEALAATNQLLAEGKTAAVNYGIGYDNMKKEAESFGQVSVTSWDNQTAALNQYQANLEKLKKMGISSVFLDAIVQNNSLADGIKITNTLMAMGPQKAAAYGASYEKMINKAKELSSKWYASDVESIKSKYTADIQKIEADLKNKLDKIAKNTMDGFYISLMRKIKEGKLGKAGKKAAKQIIKALKKALGIKSPSRVTAEIGMYTAKGMVKGLEKSENMVEKAVDNIVQMPVVRMPKMQSAVGAELSSEYMYGASIDGEVVVVTTLDGKVVAETTAPLTEEILNRRQKRESRKYGRL